MTCTRLRESGSLRREMSGISRDPEKARRQLANLAGTNPRLAARLKAGELPGWPGVLPGTEHLHPDAPAPAPPAEPVSRSTPGALPETPPTPGALPEHSGSGDQVVVLPYQEPTHATDPEPTPAAADPPEPEPEPEPGAPEPGRGVFGQFADGFLGRV